MQTYLNNVNASINLIDVCLKLGVKKLIFASSSSVLGPSPYGHSKRVIEEMLAHSGLNYTVLRYFNVFGENQRENVVKIMADALRNNEKIVINGDGSTTRDFSFVDNVVRANLKAMSSTYDGQILDVGTGKPTSLMLLYKKLRSKINPTHDKLEFGPDRIGDIKYSCAKTFLQEDEIIHFNEGIDRWLSQSSAWDNWVVRSAGTSQNLQTMN
jgi:nucleoside-diphosphate-sugar epimerase